MTREQMRKCLAGAGVTEEIAASLKTTQRLLFSALVGYRQDTTIDGNGNISKSTQDEVNRLCEKISNFDEKKLRRFLKTNYLEKAVALGAAATDRNRVSNSRLKKNRSPRMEFSFRPLGSQASERSFHALRADRE